MAEGKLRTERRLAIGCGLAVLAAPLVGCAHRDSGIGLSLEFYNRGRRPLVVMRFDFDEESGGGPGYLGPSLTESKNMGFMPGDNKLKMPESVEAEWILHSEEYTAWSKSTSREEKNSPEHREIYKKLWAANPHYIQRVDLSPILTPDIIQTVRADRLNTQLKMIVVFKDDKVEITARPYRWRKTPVAAMTVS